MTIKLLDSFWPLPKRKDYIRKLNNSHGQHEVEFQGRLIPLKVFSAPIDMPVYRLANGRTLANQKEHGSKENLPEDFFTSDPDSIEALSAQDSILRTMVNEGGLLAYFKKSRQTTPLILTAEGYVVNGNRRLCAMRMLFEEDAKSYKHFSNVRVVILPNHVERDIEELEAKLQIQPDIRADYSWLGEAMLLRTKLDNKRSISDLARLYDISEKEVKERIQQLDDADHYLISRNKPNQYSLLQKKEYAFKQLHKYRAKLPSAADKDLFTEIVFNLIDTPAKNDRQYMQIQTIYNNLNKFKRDLSKEFDAAPSKPPSKPPKKGREDNGKLPVGGLDLELLGGKKIQEPNVTKLAKAVSKPQNRGKVSTVIQDVIEHANSVTKQEKTENAFLNSLSQASTAMATAITILTGESKVKGAVAHLDNIGEALRKIKAKLAKHRNA